MSVSRARKAWTERFGPGLIFSVGFGLLVLAAFLGVTDREATPFVLAGAALAALGAMSSVVESFKAGGVEVKLREQQAREVAEALDRIRDSLQQAGPAGPQLDSVSETLSSAAAALRQGPTTGTPLRRVDPRQLEREALAWIMELERDAGRAPVPAARAEGADLISSDRKIEIKVVGSNTRWITLTQQRFEAARDSSDFWVYLVEPQNGPGDPFHVRMIGGAELRDWTASARESRLYRLRVPAMNDGEGDEPQ
jgi:hypothetical protein